MFEVFYLISARYLLAPALTRQGLSGNRYLWYAIGLLIIIQLAFTYLRPLQSLFSTVAMSGEAWLRVVGVASSVLFLVELEKMVIRRYTQ
jgi:magnesium-transporting ATPase (P-type)